MLKGKNWSDDSDLKAQSQFPNKKKDGIQPFFNLMVLKITTYVYSNLSFTVTFFDKSNISLI